MRMYVAAFALLITASTAFAQGSGTAADPWQIGSTTASAVTATLSAGTLTISGTGAMKNFIAASSAEAPWYSVRASITRIVINSGVTNIGNAAFQNTKEFRLLFPQL